MNCRAAVRVHLCCTYCTVRVFVLSVNTVYVFLLLGGIQFFNWLAMGLMMQHKSEFKTLDIFGFLLGNVALNCCRVTFLRPYII